MIVETDVAAGIAREFADAIAARDDELADAWADDAVEYVEGHAEVRVDEGEHREAAE